jgi:uncharacterized protein (DUF952 family)
MAIIFHITHPADWEQAQRQGQYTSGSLASEGFIHCSKPGQILATANRFYSGQKDLLLLAIAPARVEAEIRFENPDDRNELFPHIYGPLNLDAVTAVLPFKPEADGRFTRLPENTPGG